MPVSAEAAILQLHTWKQNRCQLRLSLLVQAVSLSVIGTSEIVEEASLIDGKFSIWVGELEVNFLADDATFELGKPDKTHLPRAALSGLTPAAFTRCLVITFRDPLPRVPALLPDASLMFCELLAD